MSKDTVDVAQPNEQRESSAKARHPPCHAASSSLALEDGTISVNVKLGDTIIGREKIPLCDAIACPVAAGDVAIVYEKLFPEFVPPGAYTVQLKAENGGGAELFCADVRFKVAPGSKARERDMYQFDRRRNPRGVSKEMASRAGEGKFWNRSAIEDGRRTAPPTHAARGGEAREDQAVSLE